MTGCIPAKGKPTARGYGQKKKNGVVKWAHRWAWIERFGPIPNGLVVMHLCDNPFCVNVDHLALGTQKGNIRDCINKKRFSFDTSFKPNGDHWNCKLSDEIVGKIRKSGLTQFKLADKYGVNQATISKIKRGILRGTMGRVTRTH